MVVQDQVLIGTILGGSSLVKPPKGVNYYLSMRSQNEGWLRYKMGEMPALFADARPRWYTNTFRVNSCCAAKLTNFHASMYAGGRRRVTMEVLNPLRDIGLAVWYLDCGSKTGRGRRNAYINTTKFGEDGAAVVAQYFNEVGMPCAINRDGSRTKVLFSVDGTEELFRVIGACVPEFMEDRL